MNNSLFRSKDYRIIEEPHGGVIIKHEIWSYYCFYENGKIGYYSAGKNTISPFFSFDNLIYKGEIEFQKDNTIKGFIDSEYSEKKEYLFKFKSSKSLEVIYLNDQKPNIDPVQFELVKLDFELIAIKYGEIVENVELRTKKGIVTKKSLFKGDQIEVIEEFKNLLKVEGGYFQKKSGWVPKSSVRMWKL